MKLNVKKFFYILTFSFCYLNVYGLELEGFVKEKGNGKQVPQALIINNNHRELFVTADDNGRFKISLPDSDKMVLIRAENYYDKIIDVSNFNKNENSIYLELLPDIVGSGIIRAKKKEEISQVNLNQEELRRTAGGGGDAVRTIQSLPSVSPSSVGSANIVVRGGDPGDNKFFYDDLLLPYVFHFGGVNTVIPTKMIESVDFYPGGFSSKYSDATGGIIQLNSQNTVPERFSGDLEAGLTQSGIYLEGRTPSFLSMSSEAATKEGKNTSDEENKIGYRIGYRRTYYEIYAPIINKTSNVSFYTFPQSTDYQLVLDGKIKNGTWQFYLLGAVDKLGILGKSGNSLDSSGQSSFNFENYFETTGIRFSKNLGNGYGLQTSFQQLYNVFKQDFGNNSIGIDQYYYSLKTSLTKNFTENNYLTFGFIPVYEIDKIHLNIFQLPAPGSGSKTFDPYTAARVDNIQSLTSIYGNTYLDFNWQITSKLKINPGVNYAKGGRSSYRISALDPRLGVRYEFLPKQTLKAAAGYYSERPSPQYNTSKYGNPNLDFERTKQFILGYETKLITDWFFDIQGWYKESSNLIGPAVTNLANKYENSVPFRAKGIDFFIKKEYLGRYYGWISYTYSQSQKKDPQTGSWKYSDYDRTNVFNLVANGKLTNKWLLGSRLQYMTGTPYTPVTSGLYNQNTGQYVPSNNSEEGLLNANNGRIPAFVQLDVRSDYDFLYNNWKLDLYVEIDNLTNQKNVSQVSYSKDYTQQLYVYGFPILPSLGVIASF